MEILLAACLLAWAAGAQSEQAKLGITPAQREIIREQVRHEKTVQKIADKHHVPAPKTSPAGVSPWKAPATEPGSPAEPLMLPAAFRAGYRGHTPRARTATPVGRFVGDRTARGVHWAKDTGRGALRQYRKTRKTVGEGDPAPVLVPLPPAHPPAVPPLPKEPPTVGAPTTGTGTGTGGGTPPTPVAARAVDDPDKAPEGAAEPSAAPDGTDGAPAVPAGPQKAADGPAIPAPRSPEPGLPDTQPAPADPGPQASDKAAPAPAETTGVDGSKSTADTPHGAEGVGRMAAEVSYESVMDESDELSLMCDDDVKVYQRIGSRCEREIGRADELTAALDSAGAGQRLIGWVARCKEQYHLIDRELEDLHNNTLAQAEKVTAAKSLLEAGQGVYAGIAADMESVADRDFYISDAVDGEDTAAHSDSYEMKGA